MKKLGRIALLAMVAALPAVPVHALNLGFAQQDAGQPGAFLDYAASARSLGMGRAHTAVADDAGAIYWNPAGLSQVERKDIVSLYSTLPQGTGFGTFNFAQPTMDMGTFGLGIVDLRSQNFDKRDTLGNRLGAFDISESAVLLSHGMALGTRWSFGGSLKVVREQIDSFSDTGYGLDLGSMYKAASNVQLGLVLQNVLAPEVKLRSSPDRYPHEIRLGVKYLPFERLLIATDLSKTDTRTYKVNFGGEFRLNDVLALRAGIESSEVTVGMGFKAGDWGIDYAFGYQDAAKGVDSLGAAHRFGVHVNFGSRISDQAISLKWQKKGQTYLDALRKQMDQPERAMDENARRSWDDNIRHTVAVARQVIRKQGYIRAVDLYEAQGYIHYYEGDYERAVESLGEAVALDQAQHPDIVKHLEKARAQMTEARTREIASDEIKKAKELYAKGDFHGAAKSCETVLSFRPDDVEAKAYLDDARARINEPIVRQMKIAHAKFDREEYLDAIKSLQKVKELDPTNKEAAQMMNEAISELEKQSRSQSASVAPDHGVYEIPRDVTKSRDFYSQGLKVYSEGNVKQAVSLWEKAVRLDQENLLARNAYNRAMAELKDKSER